MSVDIHLQPFTVGDVGTAHPAAVMTVLGPHLEDDPVDGFALLETDDGEADVYGLATCDALMFSHVSGRAVWDVIVEVAAAASYAILPDDGPACVTSPDLLADLPGDLRADARVVGSGAELLAVIQQA